MDVINIDHLLNVIVVNTATLCCVLCEVGLKCRMFHLNTKFKRSMNEPK